ncbi:myb-related transcription factor, partner of profilin-like [Mixophyes fleayi]|uniref:myb-related transcription factor, partner of profilin-like n=1 Tax=Mixophyes fleayi TaxID=3061075 RepID=UPI003F4DF82A
MKKISAVEKSGSMEQRTEIEHKKEEDRFLQKVSTRPSQQSSVAEEEDDGDDPEEGGSNITRAPRFSEQQNNILVDKIVTNYDVLYGKRAHVTSHQQRNQIWRQISDTVTSCGQVPKSVEHCRKRFRDCKRIVKKKMAASKRHAKGTGGGKPANISMKPWEVRLSEVLDPVLVEGAVDTEEPSTCLSEVENT